MHSGSGPASGLTPSRIILMDGARNASPRMRPSTRMWPTRKEKSQDPMRTPIRPPAAIQAATRRSRFPRTRWPEAPESEVNMTTKSPVPMATGSGNPR